MVVNFNIRVTVWLLLVLVNQMKQINISTLLMILVYDLSCESNPVEVISLSLNFLPDHKGGGTHDSLNTLISKHRQCSTSGTSETENDVELTD